MARTIPIPGWGYWTESSSRTIPIPGWGYWTESALAPVVEKTVTASLNAAIAKQFSVTASMAAVLQKEFQVTGFLNGVLQKEISVSASLNAFLTITGVVGKPSAARTFSPSRIRVFQPRIRN